jgi:hypothetical protein
MDVVPNNFTNYKQSHAHARTKHCKISSEYKKTAPFSSNQVAKKNYKKQKFSRTERGENRGDYEKQKRKKETGGVEASSPSPASAGAEARGIPAAAAAGEEGRRRRGRPWRWYMGERERERSDKWSLPLATLPQRGKRFPLSFLHKHPCTINQISF